MKVYIRTSEGKKFRFPVPIALVRMGLGMGSICSSIAGRYVDEQTRKYIDAIDFKLLSQCIGDLKEYRGLKLVEVKSANGEEVTIVI